MLSLIGVCVEAGDAPYIVMPYMANGSLLTFLRKERPRLTVAKSANTDTVILSWHAWQLCELFCLDDAIDL